MSLSGENMSEIKDLYCHRNLGHCLNQDCGRMTLSLKGVLHFYSSKRVSPGERLCREAQPNQQDGKNSDRISANACIGHFITWIYHQTETPHSALGYLTPVEFEKQYLS